MAIVIESTSGSTYESDSADQNIVVTKPSGTVQGDVLIAFVFKDNAACQFSQTHGFTTIGSRISYAVCSLEVFYLVAGASEPSTYTFTGDRSQGSVYAAGIARVSGVDTTDVVDQNANSTGTDSSPSYPDVASNPPDGAGVIRIFVADDNDVTDDNTPSGHTIHWLDDTTLGGDCSSGMCSKVHTTGSLGSASGTFMDATEEWITFTVTLNPATGGAGPNMDAAMMMGSNF